MRGFCSAIDNINEWAGKTFRFLIIIIAVITLLEVVTRFIFNSPTTWAQAAAIQLYGYYVAMAGGYVLLKRAEIRVDVLWSRLSPRKAIMLDMVTSVFTITFLVVLVYTIGIMARDSLKILETEYPPFKYPIYPLKTFGFIGASLLLLQVIANLIRDGQRLIGSKKTGDKMVRKDKMVKND